MASERSTLRTTNAKLNDAKKNRQILTFVSTKVRPPSPPRFTSFSLSSTLQTTNDKYRLKSKMKIDALAFDPVAFELTLLGMSTSSIHLFRILSQGWPIPIKTNHRKSFIQSAANHEAGGAQPVRTKCCALVALVISFHFYFF